MSNQWRCYLLDDGDAGCLDSEGARGLADGGAVCLEDTDTGRLAGGDARSSR